VLAAIEGGAFGAGLSLAIACDRVLAAEDARLAISFQRVGLAGDMGIFSSLPRRIGAARARQLLMLPRELTATEALDVGLVDVVAPTGTALKAALEDARRLAESPPLALAAVKRLLRSSAADPVDVLDLEAAEQVALFDSDDFGEGVQAFHDRRTPIFRGA
jgi:enoyl-CoA hydratase/carnithine racemase